MRAWQPWQFWMQTRQNTRSQTEQIFSHSEQKHPPQRAQPRTHSGQSRQPQRSQVKRSSLEMVPSHSWHEIPSHSSSVVYAEEGLYVSRMLVTIRKKSPSRP